MRNQTSGHRTSFYLFAGAATVVVASVVRARIHWGLALPSVDPLSWFLLGAARDLLAIAFLAALCACLGVVSRNGRVGRALFVLCLVTFIVAALVQSEAIIMFGAPPAGSALELSAVLSTMRASLAPSAVVLMLVTLLALAVTMFVALRVTRAVSERRALQAVVILLAFAAGGVVVFSSAHQGETATNSLFQLFGLISPDHRDTREVGIVSSLPPRPNKPVIVREMTARGDRRYFSEEYPLAYTRDDSRASIRPNFVIIALENMRTAEIGAYGAEREGITPNLDRLAREGIRVDRAWSAGTRTPMGELALWYGVLPTPGKMLLSDAPETQLTGLPEILGANGWRSLLWIGSTDQTFYRRDRFYVRRGFQMYDGTSFPASDPRVNWGISDKVLMRRSIAALDRLEQPFAAMVLTVNNHHPYQVPDDAESRLEWIPERRYGWTTLPGSDQMIGSHASQMTHTIHYTDEAVGLFFEMARSRPWFDRTVFVITGDHGIAVAPLGEQVTTQHRLTELRHQVPLIVYSPMLEGGRVVEGPASQVDVMPTLLGLAGIDVGTGVGSDLLSSPERGRPVFAWSESDRRLTVAAGDLVYSCRLDGDGGLDQSTEWLVETRADPRGEKDASRDFPEAVAQFRRWAEIYTGAYAWVVESGRSGFPQSRVGVTE